MGRAVLIATLLLGALGPGAAMADDACNVPMTNWQPREAVQQMAKAHGWTVHRIKIDDGCYEIKGEDQSGRAIEVKVDPGSLAVIRVKSKHGPTGGGHDKADRRGGSPGAGSVSGSATTPPSNGLFRGAAPPRAEIQ